MAFRPRWKQGPNKQCPCGSGKKAKNCCSPKKPKRLPERHASSVLTPRQTSATLAMMGFPAEAQEIVVYNRFKEGDPRNEGGPGGLPGKYVVAILLSRPGFKPTRESEISFLQALKGDSHIRAFKRIAERHPEDAHTIELRAVEQTGEIVFRGEGNEEGFIGKFTSQPFDAQSINDAERKAHDALSRFLSHWSLLLDVPIHIEHIETTEVRTEHKTLRIIAPPLEMNLGPAGATPLLSDDYCHYVSLYKEGLNTNSPYYRYLCFFKIAEGLKQRIETRNRRAAEAGEPMDRRALLVPASEEEMLGWLREIYPWRQEWDAMSIAQIFPAEARGKKVNALLNGRLNTIRLGIAHAVVKTGEPLISVDNLQHQRDVNNWLPFLRCVARHMLRTEFRDQFVYPTSS